MQIDAILTQRQLAKRLQKLYILALSAIALGSIIGQLVIQYCIGQQQSDAKVVNLAGRQRMLSQRLCKTSILLANPEIYLADDELYLQDLYEIMELWDKVHQGLKGGMLDLGTKIKVQNSPKIDSMLRAI